MFGALHRTGLTERYRASRWARRLRERRGQQNVRNNASEARLGHDAGMDVAMWFFMGTRRPKGNLNLAEWDVRENLGQRKTNPLVQFQVWTPNSSPWRMIPPFMPKPPG